MSKYGNKRTVVDGYKFDSLAEARRYSELKLMERAGEIRDLVVHYPFTLRCPVDIGPIGTTIGDTAAVSSYEADFVYWRVVNKSEAGGMPLVQIVVEDVKGHRTDMYRLKKKWLKLEYGIEIQEIEA